MKDTASSGQALVEFVLILPIIILLLFVIIDFSRVYYEKNHLEGVLNDIVIRIEEKKSLEDINNIYKNYNIKTEYDVATHTVNVKVSNNINLITPLSKNILSNPYKVTVERIVLYE